MAISPVDRDPQYMKDTWGTTRLITDYTKDSKKVLQEIMYDPAPSNKTSQQELFETSEDDLCYGIEPTYRIGKHQKLICD
jgi:hypothetical protein